MSTQASRAATTQTQSRDPELAWLNIVREQVESLKFGTVLVTVHDSKVVQIERNEKTRLDPVL